jgi:hypothetical protein
MEPGKSTLSQIRIAWQSSILMLVISLIILAGVPSARAQSMAFATITIPDTNRFPKLTTYLDAFDDQGNFITNLTPVSVSILENGEQITPDTLESLDTPLSFVLAINSDPALAVRDGLGLSRYDKIRSTLDNWAASLASDSSDKLALVWNGGIVASHLTPAEWKARLDGFDPAPRTSSNSLAALAFALDASQEMENGTTVKKSILLISGHLGLKDQNSINDMISRAIQAHVRIYVWITDSADFQLSPGALALQDLALATGGRFVTFSGSETLPSPEEWFSSLRNIYQLTYSSKIRTGGKHTLSVQVNSANLALTSPTVNFPLDIQPPSAALLSAPIQIVRQNPETPFDLESFTPTQQEISALVEFPDGHQRPIKRTALFVDGLMIAENTSEPFNRFTWNLSGYLTSGDHSLQVEAEDILGLSQMSAEVPVQVTIVQPPGGMAGLILRNRAAVTIAFMVLAGTVVLGIIILGGRKGLTSLSERRKARAAQLDPLTQPIQTNVAAPSAGRGNPFPWLRRKEAPPPAYFVPFTSDGKPTKGDPISINGQEITFGSDPTQATIVLDDPSLSGLHARLRRTENNTFTLLDQNSTAGTWVNYELSPQAGHILEHGDVIHFGNLTYRFVLAKPPATPKPTITPI